MTGPTRIVSPHDGRTFLYEWTLTENETGLPVVVPHKAEKTVHIYGTFGGAVSIEGSLETVTPTNFVVLSNSKGEDMANITANYLRSVQENPYLIRPVAGAGVSAVTVRLLMVGV